MPEKIPITSDPAQSFTVALEGGRKYLFDIQYNNTGGFWTFDLTAEPSGVRLVAGAPILIGQDLLAPYALSIGGLLATDTSGTGLDAGPEDLGDRVTLTWLSEAEMALVPGPEPLVFVPVVAAAPIVPVVPPWTPLSLGSTLKLWLRGDLGVTQSGGNVTAWADQSGNGNNVTGSVPYNASSIGGNPGLTFSATGLINSTSNIIPGSSARTIFAVLKQTSGAANSVLTIRIGTLKADYITPFGTAGTALIYTDGVNNPNNAFLVAAAPSVTGLPLIVEWQSSAPGTTLVYKQNGVVYPASQAAGSSTDNGTTGFTIGGGGATYVQFVGDIDELIVCDTQLPAPDELAAKTYFSTRYGIAVV